MEYNTFLQRVAKLPIAAAIRLLLGEGLQTKAAPAFWFFHDLDGLPDVINDGDLSLQEEEMIVELRNELARVEAWTDDEAEAQLAEFRAKRESQRDRQDTLLDERLSTVKRLFKAVIAWRPQLDDDEAQEWAEVFRAYLLTHLAVIRAWAEEIHTRLRDTSVVPATGAAFRDAEIQELRARIADAENAVVQTYAGFRLQLPGLLDLRRHLDAMSEPTA